MTSRNGRPIAEQETMPQFGFALDDPDSRTRSSRLQAVYAQVQRVESFSMDLFAGFSEMRALTYMSSIPMVLRLLRDYDYSNCSALGVNRPRETRINSFVRCIRNIAEVVSTVMRAQLLIRRRLQSPTIVVSI